MRTQEIILTLFQETAKVISSALPSFESLNFFNMRSFGVFSARMKISVTWLTSFLCSPAVESVRLSVHQLKLSRTINLNMKANPADNGFRESGSGRIQTSST